MATNRRNHFTHTPCDPTQNTREPRYNVSNHASRILGTYPTVFPARLITRFSISLHAPWNTGDILDNQSPRNRVYRSPSAPLDFFTAGNTACSRRTYKLFDFETVEECVVVALRDWLPREKRGRVCKSSRWFFSRRSTETSTRDDGTSVSHCPGSQEEISCCVSCDRSCRGRLNLSRKKMVGETLSEGPRGRCCD